VQLNPAVVPPFGQRIREERARLGVSVRGLAREIGVSASLISQIETGRSQPSVSTLYSIVTALGISIEDLFMPATSDGQIAEPPNGDPDDLAAIPDDAVEPAVVSRGHSDGDTPGGTPGTATSTVVSGLSAAQARQLHRDPDRRVGPVVHPDDREALTLESGVTWELLGQVPGLDVDFLLVTYESGGSSSISGTLMRHTGIEYAYMISGELILTLGFDEHRLHPGDSISFDSTTPHGYRNEGSAPAVGVWFIAEPTR
jgi:transcriptional regulator with XRE-family HTH domain/quercetin dioxygenase-like cupin family protein